MTQVLIDRATLEKALKLAFNLGQTYWQQADSDYVSQQNKSDGTREKFNQLITDTCSALANAERVEPEPTRIERKVYKNSAEHSDYLSAQFTKDKQAGSFEWQGHRWAYHWTSFDDEGDFDLIYRNTTPKDMP